MSLRKDPKIRLLKRIVFGKKDPSFLLKWTCIIGAIWSLLLFLLMGGLGAFSMVSEPVSSAHQGVKLLQEIGYKFFFAYAGLHFISVFAITQMYRLKVFGFYLYTAANVACFLLPYYMIKTLDFPLETAVFSGVAVGLFAIHYGKFTREKVAVEEEVAVEEQEEVEA